MKTSFRTIILAAAAIFAAMSCQKEAADVPEIQDRVKAGETIQVNITASLGDLTAADATKATATSVVRLTWETGDKVQAYCGTDKIGTDLTVTPSENGMFASLTGEITAPDAGKTITFVFSSGCTADGLTFDFSSQTAIPFVAYGTLVYEGKAITNKMIEFRFATSVMKIAATGLGGGTISNATISGINTKVTLTPKADSETCGIAGSEKSKITKTAGIDASSDGTKAIITVGLVPDNTEKPYRALAISQTGYTNKGVITSSKIESNISYTTPAALFTCGTLGSGANAHDYVLIAGTKWATQNLAISGSGKGQWKSVTLPGTTTPVQIGDYFQWGAYKGYTTEANSDKGLLIYTAFTNNGSSGSFTWKNSNHKFYDSHNPPYRTGSTYTEYATEKSSVLAPSDDVAHILWADTWRMPTSAEFKALYDATYWKWDGTDKGYYVYAPQPGDAGKKNNESKANTSYDKSVALLFFPAAGFGGETNLSYAGNPGQYWSSSLLTSNTIRAYILLFGSDNVEPQRDGLRSYGRSVRPVSD